MDRRSAIALVAGLILFAGVAAAASKEEEALFQGCDWLERAIAREPAREDAFGMVMASMRPKCTAMLEGVARKDNSVRPDAMRQIVKELADLQSIIDAEHGGPPPAGKGPSAADLARQKVNDEKAEKDKVAMDKAAADKAAADKAAADKAAADKAAADQAAADKAAEEARKVAERDAKRTEVGDKKADAEAKRIAEREERERIAAEKKAAEEERKRVAREERERVAAEKKAAEEERKREAAEARERAAAEKKAVEEAKREAERQKKLGAMDEAERKRAEEEAARMLEADRKAEAERRAAEERRIAAEREAGRKTAPKPGKGQFDGTWEQPEAKVLDRHVKRTLNILTKDKKIQGELYEEVWFAAPSAWIDSSCGGNETFRMVTTARVSGEIEGGNLVLSRDAPRILTCTCSSRCTVERRRRGMDLKVAASGAELRDSTGVFVRPGTQVSVTSDPEVADSKKVMSPRDFAGNWETAPFKQRDQMVVRRIELEIDGDGKMTGTMVERSSQGLPLANWADRFCGGADKWEWVTQWKLEGKVNGRKIDAKAKDGSNLLCSCPSKCTAPKDKLSFDLVYGATGATLHLDDQVFERRP